MKHTAAVMRAQRKSSRHVFVRKKRKRDCHKRRKQSELFGMRNANFHFYDAAFELHFLAMSLDMARHTRDGPDTIKIGMLRL